MKPSRTGIAGTGFYLIWLAALLVFVGCSHNKAQHHMHRHNFEELVKHFDDPARDAWQKPGAVLATLADQMKRCTVSAPIVADLGAGSGYFTFRLLDAGYKVKALDLDSRFVAYLEGKAAKHPRGSNLETRQATPENANLKDAEVDAILSVDVYHHIENRVVYFSRLKKSLRGKNPLVMIIDFKDGDQPAGPPPHIKVPTEKILFELRDAGYETTVDSTTLPYQNIFLATPMKLPGH